MSMYLHVGNGKTLRSEDVVGIFDLDTATVSPVTRAYLSRAEKDGRTESTGGELPKCFVVMKSKTPEKRAKKPGKINKDKADKVVFLRISSVSLRARAEFSDWSEEE